MKHFCRGDTNKALIRSEVLRTAFRRVFKSQAASTDVIVFSSVEKNKVEDKRATLV